MYKTVRHGENSLQYTILPQTEEVLNNSGLKGKGRDYSPSIHVRRTRRRSTLKYVLLIVFGIIIALALASVPLYIMNATVYARRNLQVHHEYITSPTLTLPGRKIEESRKKEIKILPVLQSTLRSKLDVTSPSLPIASISTQTATSVKITNPPITIPALRSWKSIMSTTSKPATTENLEEMPLIGTPSGSVRLLDNYMSIKPWEKDIIIWPTMTPEPTGYQTAFKYYPFFSATSDKSVTQKTKPFDDVLITTRATTTMPSSSIDYTTAILPVDEDDEFKESLEVDEVFSLPPVKPESAVPVSDSDEVTVLKASGSRWYGARWPFVDTSSYFQWTGYSLDDNLLLPLLVAALSSIVLVLLLALVVRRRRSSTTASAQIGKLTAELQADDNTNLLTAENPDEIEE